MISALRTTAKHQRISLRWRFLWQIICAVVPQLTTTSFKNRPNSGSIAILPSPSIFRFMQVYADSLSTAQLIPIYVAMMCVSPVPNIHIFPIFRCVPIPALLKNASHLYLGIFDATDPLTALSTNHFPICTAKNINPLK